MKKIIRKILKEETDITKPTVIFVGGCDSSSNSCKDKEGNIKKGFTPLDGQTQLLQSGLGGKFNIVSFGHYNYESALSEIGNYSDPYVVLFSAGCSKSHKFSSKLKTKGDMNKLFIVEPYSCSSGIKNNVNTTKSDGVPSENVFGGNSNCTGKNVAGTFRTDYGGKDHWGALKGVGSVIKNSYVEPIEDKGGIFNDYDNSDPNRYSDTLHPYNYKNSLKEQEEDIEISPFEGALFTPKFMEKMMVKMDEDPDFFLKDILPNMGFDNNQEINVIYNYLTEYDRKSYYIPIFFDWEDLSNFFSDDRDYDIQGIIKRFFEGDYDYYDGYEACYGYQSYYFDMVDKVNIDTMKEKYSESHKVYDEDEFMEFVEEEFGGDIGCAVSDAQHSADVDYLHSDIKNSILDYLSDFNGKLEHNVDKEGNSGEKMVYNGSREVGDIVSSDLFKETLVDHVEDGYTSFGELFDTIYNSEKDEEAWGIDNVLLPEDKIQINTDRHFRYGGAGDIDEQYFNEILSDRIAGY